MHSKRIYVCAYAERGMRASNFIIRLKQKRQNKFKRQKRKFKSKKTYIVEDDAHEYIQRNAEEVHDCASGLLRYVL